MNPVVVALTPGGAALGQQVAEAIGGELQLRGDAFTRTAPHLRALFAEDRPIVGICAAGILVRALAPALADKRAEPPVVALAEDGSSAVPLLGGHRGANDLARRIAAALGGHAAITTAGDLALGVALDAPPPGWRLANPGDAPGVMAALIAGEPARLEGEADWLRASRIRFSEDATVRLIAATGRAAGAERTLVYHPQRLALGVGCERGAEPDELATLVDSTLTEAGLAAEAVACVVSLDLKADEAAVLELAEWLGVPARFFPAEQLEQETPRLASPSEAVFREVGCHGVAEAAALAATGPDGWLAAPKRKSARATCAIAEAPAPIDPAAVGRARGRLAIVGIGPGAADWLTPEARRLIEGSDALVGYSLYLDLIAGLAPEAERFAYGLGAEAERCEAALRLAGEGHNVALVSSGDPGIYAMATLVFELLDEIAPADGLPLPRAAGEGDHAKHGGGGGSKGATVAAPSTAAACPRAGRRPDPGGGPPPPLRGAGSADCTPPFPASARRVEIVVAPGISALQAAAARAGAPLGHDFCAISLSDLLTPWAAIEARIEAAAAADFAVAFYNPVSQRRQSQLAAARAILLEHRAAETPVVVARNLGRDAEAVTLTTLGALDPEALDMLSIVLVGASTTARLTAGGRDWLYTPRGYAAKVPAP